MAGSIVSPKRVLMTGWISWKNKNMDDSAGNGKLLGLKKTDRYWLVHKNVFESKEIAGKMRINIASFEKMVCQSD